MLAHRAEHTSVRHHAEASPCLFLPRNAVYSRRVEAALPVAASRGKERPPWPPSLSWRSLLSTARFCAVLVCCFGCGPGRPEAAPHGNGGNGVSPAFQFVQISDLHLGKSSPQPEDNLRRAVGQITELDADLVLVTGDLTDHGKTAEYAALKEILGDLPMPFHCVPGDNDILDGEGDLQRYRQELGADFDSFDVHGYRFIGLNNVLNPALDPEQGLWLEQELGTDLPAIVFAHKALLDGNNDFEPFPAAAPLASRMEERGVLLYMNGDVHESAEIERNGVAHVWCDNLNFAHTGIETYNLYRVYADSIDLYHVDFGGSAAFVARFPLGGP
jgi:hypothetical protein